VLLDFRAVLHLSRSISKQVGIWNNPPFDVSRPPDSREPTPLGPSCTASAWWLIWSPTEEMTYNGYGLRRVQSLTRSKPIAVLIVAFWWAIQHSFIPFMLDWKYVVWRFLFFLPGVVIACLIYLRLRQLAPLVLAHWGMDLMAAFLP
jgi:membrane protease YdiL (CAAX protease family)